MGSVEQIPSSEDSSLTFDNLPTFPDNVPTAPLLRISLARLVANDAAEEERLWRACCDLGFFYLDCRDSSSNNLGNNLVDNANKLFDLGDRVFSLPVEEKQKYDMMGENSYYGYKGYGAGVIDKKGTRDRTEFWNLSKDDFCDFDTERIKNPEILKREDSRAVVKGFMEGGHAVVTLILGKLNQKLGLPGRTLQDLHRLHAKSGDQVRWVKSPPQPLDDRRTALGEHTDFGSVTVLFNRLGGLQVLPPGEGSQWSYVKPLRGHCVINLGDAMVKFTAGLLRSNIHRVVNPPGQQQDSTRFSLVYFARPEDEVLLKVLDGSALIEEERKRNPSVDEGEVVDSKTWILRRAMGRRVGGDYESGQGTDRERIEKAVTT